MTKIIHPKSIAELNYIIDHSNACIVDFYGDRCPPCKALGAYLDVIIEQENKYPNISFVKINCDDSEFDDVLEKYEVSGIPRIIGFKTGKLNFDLEGYDKPALIKYMEKLN
jgi:thioredoxin 1